MRILWAMVIWVVIAVAALAFSGCAPDSPGGAGSATAGDEVESGPPDGEEQETPGDVEEDGETFHDGRGDYTPVAFDKADFDEATMTYVHAMQPELFVGCVDNPYFPLIPGTVYHLEEETEEGLETITVTVTKEIRQVAGIAATVVRDTVRLEGELIEDTWDWYAQDDRGNVWYLGEETYEYEGGEVVSNEGSWEAGVDGAIAGIIMPGQPRPGDLYYQEYYPGEAEDMGAIVGLAEAVDVAIGSFDGVLQTADYNPLGDQLEHKWYARGIGVVQEAIVGGDGMMELVSISRDDSQLDPGRACGQNGGVSTVPPSG
jgi:hypothetical protein